MFQTSKKKVTPEQASSEEHAFAYCLFLLNRMSRSTGQLQERCEQRGYEPKVIQKTVQRLLDLKFVDDQEFARSYVERQLAYGSHGWQYLRNKLREKKIPSELISGLEAMFAGHGNIRAEKEDIPRTSKQSTNQQEFKNPATELAACLRVLPRLEKLLQYKKYEPYELRHRLIRRLAQRGFGYDVITQALSLYQNSETES